MPVACAHPTVRLAAGLNGLTVGEPGLLRCTVCLERFEPNTIPQRSKVEVRWHCPACDSRFFVAGSQVAVSASQPTKEMAIKCPGCRQQGQAIVPYGFDPSSLDFRTDDAFCPSELEPFEFFSKQCDSCNQTWLYSGWRGLEGVGYGIHRHSCNCGTELMVHLPIRYDTHSVRAHPQPRP